MSVSRLTSDGDWTFGKGRANYVTESAEIAQNVITRLKSFKDDYFLDLEHGIGWREILGQKGTENQMRQEIERTVLQTDGVRSIEQLSISVSAERAASINISYRDIYDVQTTKTVVI